VCGANHFMCLPCLTALSHLGDVTEEIKEIITESADVGLGICTTTYNEQNLGICPVTNAGARTAILLSREDA